MGTVGHLTYRNTTYSNGSHDTTSETFLRVFTDHGHYTASGMLERVKISAEFVDGVIYVKRCADCGGGWLKFSFLLATEGGKIIQIGRIIASS
ncbi:hypothetical protein AVEN_178503-1 [Araneus ventricosus]|uniref:Uncharacterized protein n=1 Tax=Araneus ventricosus TaxID=182803 RepID=A0A4Y2CE08_ARAVE|nr:hypothetical protein AVEN_178503-1 [Araneus ventricosus]